MSLVLSRKFNYCKSVYLLHAGQESQMRLTFFSQMNEYTTQVQSSPPRSALILTTTYT